MIARGAVETRRRMAERCFKDGRPLMLSELPQVTEGEVRRQRQQWALAVDEGGGGGEKKCLPQRCWTGWARPGGGRWSFLCGHYLIAGASLGGRCADWMQRDSVRSPVAVEDSKEDLVWQIKRRRECFLVVEARRRLTVLRVPVRALAPADACLLACALAQKKVCLKKLESAREGSLAAATRKRLAAATPNER